jgi:acyl-CoA synthetase (AMP-forming)/AMP-acid ligase II
MSLSDDRAALTERWYREGFYGRETIADHLRTGAEAFPDTAMHFVGGPSPSSIRLGEMYRRSRSVATGLADLGVGPGDIVAIWVPNWLEGALTYQAALMLGATVVPIIHIYGPHEVSFILRQSGARVLVLPDRWRTIDYRERFDALVDVPALEHVVSIGDHGPSGAIPWQRVAAHDPIAELPATHPDDRCLLIYTSGTTADPKGVQHTTNTLIAEIRSTAAALGEREGVNLAAFPAGHIAGVLGLLRMFVLGTSSVVMDTWDPALAARLVAEHGITTTAGAPFYLASLMDEAERQGTSLATMGNYMVGAASVPTSLVERADRVGIPVYRAYGSSEHPVITTGTPTHPLDKRAGTDGTLTPGNSIRLLDDDDCEVGVGEDGEIVSLGPELFIGYTDPALDADSFLPGGWFRTGDIGRVDADGFLTITDRKKDVIIRGGENIASKEVEDLLMQHPAVVEAAAVGRPDERYGERVAVFVQLRDGTSIDVDEVRRHFAAIGVAKQKTPEHIVVVDEFPRTPTGKIRKVDLRRRLTESEVLREHRVRARTVPRRPPT